MADKYIDVRIAQKIDTTANWETNNPVLLKGEIGIEQKIVGESTVYLVKVGDGSLAWNSLPYAQAAAADVYAWAKAAVKPTYTYDEVGAAAAVHTHVMTDVTGLKDWADGVDSSISDLEKADEQINTALAGKAAAEHTHAQSEVTGLTEALAGKSDTTHSHTLASLGAAAEEHTHEQSEITGLTTALAGKANSSHTHAQSEVTGLADALDAKADASHTHAQSEITGLTAALEGKAAADHTHTPAEIGASAEGHKHEQSDINGLSTALAGKANATHGHEQSEINGLVDALAGKAASDHTHTYSDVGAAAASHTHAQGEIDGLTDALAGKAAANHTHTYSDVGAAAASHSHEQSEINGLVDALGEKATKVSGATNGNFAGLDANGNLTDSGKKAADFATAEQGAKADAAMPIAGGTFTGSVSGVAPTADANLTTKQYVDEQIAANVASVFKFKGTVATVAELPTAAKGIEGHVYHVTADHSEYVCAKVDGATTYSWESLGGVIDLSDYAKSADVIQRVTGAEGQVAKLNADGTLSSTGYTLGTNVPADAVFTDTGVNEVVANNGLTQSVDGRKLTLGIEKISTDLLENGSNTLIFDCGTSAI